jgi:gamma-glutamylputrescine oxidase
MPNVFVAGGFSGHGMPYVSRSGQLLANAVVNGTLSPALKPFRLDRPTLRKWKDGGQDDAHPERSEKANRS